MLYVIFTNDLPSSIFTCEKHQGETNIQNEIFCKDCGSVCSYADDSTLTVSGKDPIELSAKLSEKFEIVSDYLKSNKLKVNEEKTQLLLMTTEQNRRKNNPTITLTTNSGEIEPMENATILGGLVDQNLKWKEFIVDADKSLVKSLNTRLNAFKKVCSTADKKTKLMVANGLLISKLIYLLPVWGGCGSGLIRMLQVIQNNAARYITRSVWYTSTSELMKGCNWLSVSQLAAYHSILTVKKILLVKEPLYFYDKFNSQYPLNTRLAASRGIRMDERFQADLALSQSSFRWRASQLYNRIPLELRIPQFKVKLKEWVLNNIPL